MAWVRGPLARLVRGVGGYYLGSRTTGPPGAGGGGYGLGSRATGPPSVGGRTIVTPQAPPLAGETGAMAWVRGPLARLVRNAY